MVRVATDIGGTFTDLVLFDDAAPGERAPVRIRKEDTRPADLTEGVARAIVGARLDLGDVAFLAHGSTVVINTLLERKGARTGLITTRGFRDVLEIARGNRPDLFNFRFRKPPPFVPRYLRCEVDERVDHCGRILRPLDIESLDRAVDHLRTEGLEALAVCFLHAYANPENERVALEHLRRIWPEVSVIASHQTSREWREYERTSTTVLSAYVAPITGRYLETLAKRLAAGGMAGPPFIMQSNGGLASVAMARRNPVALAESGPAAGVLGAASLSALLDRPNVIALDIGGTTAKCSLIVDGRPAVTTDYAIEADRFNPGYPIKAPVIDIVEIGTGGGSIASVDAGGKLHVGPQSAGADPGPVIYGRGGDRPTVTDAHVLTGRIDARQVLGGRGPDDIARAREAYARLAGEVGVPADDMPRGVLRLAEVNLENAVKLVSLNRGHDPRDFALIAYGGGGPLHAGALARALRIPTVIVPVNASVFSAWGMLLADLRRDYVRTANVRLESAAPEHVTGLFGELEAEAEADFSDQSLPAHRLVLQRTADMRYRGQEHTVKVDLPAGAIDDKALTGWASRFRAVHDRIYGVRLDLPVDAVALQVAALGIMKRPELRPLPKSDATPDVALTGRRSLDLGDTGRREAAIYDRGRLAPEMTVSGPAIFEEPGSAIVIWPGQSATVDDHGNLLIATDG